MIKAKYTVVLKSLLDDETTKAKINEALSKYPLYQPEKLYDMIPNRSELNQKVLNHYKYREIGFETVGRFIDELEITMCEIMPRYNELFKTVEIMAELPSPFDNVDVTEKITDTREVISSGSSSNNTVSNDTSNIESNTVNDSKNVKSTTPQNEMNVPAKNIDSIGYADEVNWNKNTANDSSTTTGNSESESNSSSEGTAKELYEHTYTKIGNQGVNTYAHDMIEFRDTIIDYVDQIIHDERLSALFMRVF